jgi:glycosyltransferase involved in cell wall biosynthesis
VIRRKGIPIIQTLHDYKLICPVSSLLSRGKICEGCKSTRYYNCLLKRCSPFTNSLLKSAIHMVEGYLNRYILHHEDKVECFISPSRFLKEKMIEFGLSEEKIVHIPNFIYIDEYKPNFYFDNYLVYFGRLSYEKGIDILIKAMKGISGIDLLIVGNGPNYRDYIKLIQDMGIKNIRFLGYRGGDELHGLVRNALCSIMPSRWYENNPLSIIESFALGTPAIGTDIGGIPELINEWEDGLLCEPCSIEDLRDKINDLINNKGKIKEMGENARKKVEERYSPSIFYERLIKLYDKLTSV